MLRMLTSAAKEHRRERNTEQGGPGETVRVIASIR